MKEKPILLNTEMVKAILDGRKTQTRRVIKSQPTGKFYNYGHVTEGLHKSKCYRHGAFFTGDDSGFPWTEHHICPYGSPGGELWVRETWFNDAIFGKPILYYRANGEFNEQFKVNIHNKDELKWKPSIFMPRWASRIQLLIKDIRVERVQDISPENCLEEGVRSPTEFIGLWDSINEKRGFGWSVDPWVWVVEFEVKK